MSFCKQCGKELSEGIKFCGSCGAQVVADQQASVAAKPPVQEAPRPTNGAKIPKPRMNVGRILLAFIAVVLLCSGGYSLYQKMKPQSPIVGLWRAVGEQVPGDLRFLIFSPDGIFSAETFASDKYVIKDDNRIALGSGKNIVEFTYTLIDNSQLTIHDFDFIGSPRDVAFERAGNLSAPAEISVGSPLPFSKIILDRRDGSTVCSSLLKQIALAMSQFVQDHNKTFALPVSVPLVETLWPYTKSQELFQCPNVEPGNISYSFNTNLTNVPDASIKNPANTVMIYEGQNGVLDFRHEGKAGVAFADGNVKFVTSDEASSLQWQP